MKLWLDRVPSPIGTLLLAHDGAALRALDFHDYEPRMRRLFETQYGEVELIAAPGRSAFADALQGYFDGDLAALDDIEVETAGTPFQREVWAALRTIPAATTTSYGRLAAEIGRPGASRAVGLANGQNPIAIVVPCHRVIGADGSLTGFGGGLPRKQWLLAHEAKWIGTPSLFPLEAPDLLEASAAP